MTADDDWMSWAEAARLVGCPVTTIEWHARTGRIERRPHDGDQRRTLQRESVEAFAVRWREQQADRAGRRGRSRSTKPPTKRRSRAGDTAAPDGAVSRAEAARTLGVTAGHIAWLVRHGHLAAQKNGGLLWLRVESVNALAAERGRWISVVAAAELAGCAPSSVLDAAHRGDIRQRRLGRNYPSLDRDSVCKWAEQRRELQLALEQARDARRYREQLAGRPDLEHEWLTHTQAGKVLGISRNRVAQLASDERLPFTLVARRRWFRRDHIERVAAARQFASQFS